MRIVVDAMGGDHAPGVVVEGAVQGARDLDVGVVLVGPEAVVRPLAAAAAGSARRLEQVDVSFVEASESVGMDELPLPAIRKKKKCSILVGLRLVRDGGADAFVSAGNTGAVMAAATIVLRRIPGVERAALAALLPTARGQSVLLDVGANVEVRSQHLEQFAVMGSCFARAVRGLESPRVALLSVGEEEIKGNDLVRKVHQHLKRGPVNFVGNVDGSVVYSGEVDVIVTDGFTGNAILKSSESLLKELVLSLREEIGRSRRAQLGALLMRPLIRGFRQRLDHSEYGAVPLLGVSRPVFIGHGSSSAKSIRSAIRVAKTFVEARVNDAIQDQLAQLARSSPDVPRPEDVGAGAPVRGTAPAGDVPSPLASAAGGDP